VGWNRIPRQQNLAPHGRNTAGERQPWNSLTPSAGAGEEGANENIEQHRLGVDAFDRKYGTDLRALAAEFARRSPDVGMRAALKLVQAQTLVDTTRTDITQIYTKGPASSATSRRRLQTSQRAHHSRLGFVGFITLLVVGLGTRDAEADWPGLGRVGHIHSKALGEDLSASRRRDWTWDRRRATRRSRSAKNGEWG